jgi:hypothetical protein
MNQCILTGNIDRIAIKPKAVVFYSQKPLQTGLFGNFRNREVGPGSVPVPISEGCYDRTCSDQRRSLGASKRVQ